MLADSIADEKNTDADKGRIALPGLWVDPVAGIAENTEGEEYSNPLNISGV